jgi:quinol monooxygenase YgiN
LLSSAAARVGELHNLGDSQPPPRLVEARSTVRASSINRYKIIEPNAGETAMPQVHHVVLVKFKPGQDQQAPPLFAALAALQRQMPGMVSYRYGANVSPEGLNHGFTHGFVMIFTDTAARDRYLTDPEHEKVKMRLLPWLENIVVFDFEG